LNLACAPRLIELLASQHPRQGRLLGLLRASLTSGQSRPERLTQAGASRRRATSLQERSGSGEQTALLNCTLLLWRQQIAESFSYTEKAAKIKRCCHVATLSKQAKQAANASPETSTKARDCLAERSASQCPAKRTSSIVAVNRAGLRHAQIRHRPTSRDSQTLKADIAERVKLLLRKLLASTAKAKHIHRALASKLTSTHRQLSGLVEALLTQTRRSPALLLKGGFIGQRLRYALSAPAEGFCRRGALRLAKHCELALLVNVRKRLLHDLLLKRVLELLDLFRTERRQS
jgi:hypothetical protein